MKDKINNKFSGIRNKWIKIPLDSKEVVDINSSIVSSINNKVITKHEALNLFKCFKSRGFIWAKYNKTAGRKNLNCKCQIVTFDNKKIDFILKPEFLINTELLEGTPKSLKLYNFSNKKEIIVDPKDGFDDGMYPPAWMEFTAEAYEEYKIEYYEKMNRERNKKSNK